MYFNTQEQSGASGTVSQQSSSVYIHIHEIPSKCTHAWEQHCMHLDANRMEIIVFMQISDCTRSLGGDPLLSSVCGMKHPWLHNYKKRIYCCFNQCLCYSDNQSVPWVVSCVGSCFTPRAGRCGWYQYLCEVSCLTVSLPLHLFSEYAMSIDQKWIQEIHPQKKENTHKCYQIFPEEEDTVIANAVLMDDAGGWGNVYTDRQTCR